MYKHVYVYKLYIVQESIRGQVGHYNTVKIPCLKQYSPEILCEKLTNAPWSPVLESIDVNEAWHSCF